jgi:uncharacterized coiled-coil protein SlyX
MNNEMSDRLQKLESSIAHLERQVEQLNEVIIDQGKLIDRLKKEVLRQSEILKTAAMEQIKANNPRPPHH